MRFSLLLYCAFAACHLSAQELPRLWGMTPSGGANNKGTVFAVDADGTDFQTVYDFTEASGWGPEGGLCLAPNGLLYGMTTLGGEASPAAGTLFTIDPATGVFTKLRDFNITNGGFNWGALIVGADGMLYGAGYGGTDGGGSIYRVDPDLGGYTELYALDQATDGAGVNSRLLEDDGWLYGAASQGGANGESGTLFKYDPENDAFVKLHDLDGAAGGRTPYGGLCAADNGWLYGTTFEGGEQNKGVVYRYHPVNDTYEVVLDLYDADGANCWTTLVNAGPDLLLGTTATGGLQGVGFIFTLVPSTGALTEVHPCTVLGGSAPAGSLTAAPDGMLYGMTSGGGTGFYGTLYSFDPVTLEYTTLHPFTNGTDGGMPRGEVLAAGAAVGIHEVQERSWSSLAPNPTEGDITLHCAIDELPAQAALFDAQGRWVHTFRITSPATTLSLDGCTGLYALTLTGRTRTATQRVVVR